MAFMKPHSFLVWWNSAQVTTDGMNVSSLVDGEERFTNLENPLLGTLDYPKKPKSFGKLAFILVALLAVTCFVLATIWSSSDRFELHGKLRSDAPDTVSSKKGVVTCDDERCSKVGVMILNLGGHAVDAAVATAMCLGVVSPSQSGIGGGSFMVFRNASNSQTIAINMRDVAPAAASKDMYKDDPEAQVTGPLSIAVPGEIAGLHKAWKMYGRLPWRTLLQPAIEYAGYGFEVSPFLAFILDLFEANVKADPGLSQIYAPTGKVLKTGEICYNEKLAETLEAVAELGPQAYYDGPVSEKLINDLKSIGAIITKDDLRNYKVKIVEALEVDTIMGFKLLGMPPPSSGTVGITMVANILNYYGTPDVLNSPLGSHRLVEAMKHMFAIRTNLGDPAFDDVSKYVTKMTSPKFAKEIWGKINDSTTFPFDYYQSRWNPIQDGGTSHLSVVDEERNTVALTTSVNDPFGAFYLSPSTGIVLNNDMRDFSTPAQVPTPTANLIEPGKTPLSSMSPLIILKDGELVGVLGGSGGEYIVGAVLQVFFNHFVQGLPPRESVVRTRVFGKLILNENDVDYENVTVFNGDHIELPKSTREFLTQRHHRLHRLVPIGFSPVCHLISQKFENSIDLGRKIGNNSIGGVKIGTLTAVGDLRKDAKPAAQRG